MWQCPNCNESVEDNFDICWNCGSTRDGTIVATFGRESDEEPGGSESEAESTLHPDGGMNRREIAALICKTLALIMFAEAALISVTGVVLIVLSLFVAPFDRVINWYHLQASLVLTVPMLAALAVGLFYWKRSDAIASQMVSANPAPVTGLSLTVEDVMLIAFSTAGVLILVDGVVDFFVVVLLAHQHHLTMSQFWYNPETGAAVAQVALATWLILGSRGIVRAVRWLHTAGVAVPDETPENEEAA